MKLMRSESKTGEEFAGPFHHQPQEQLSQAGERVMNSTGHRNTSRRARVRQPQPRGRSTGGWRLACSLVLTYALVLPLAGVPAAFAQTGPRPGQNNPVEDYTLFPSHSVAAFAPDVIVPDGSGVLTLLKGFRTDQQLQLTEVIGDAQFADSDQVVAAAGRISLTDGKEQVVFARRPHGTSGLQVFFLAVPKSNVASHVFNDLAPRLPFSVDFIDIAAGDLDNVTDSAGHFHDEVVVAYASPGANNQIAVQVAVLDYTDSVGTAPTPGAVTPATASTFINGNDFATTPSPQIMPVDNVLGVAVGDFDGDGRKEIAVLHIQDHQKMWITMFRYTNDGQGSRSLKEVSSVSQDATSLWAGTVDVAAGDFDGKGKDELLTGVSEWSGQEAINQFVGFNVWQADDSLNMTRKGSLGGIPSSNVGFSSDAGGRSRVQISPGLFKYDVANGFDVNRRQFVAAWNVGDGSLRLATYQISDDLSTINQINSGPWYGTANQRFSIAAGAYKGNASIQTPEWSVALATWSTGGTEGLGQASLYMLNGDLTDSGNLATLAITNGVDGAGRFPVVAFDLDGKSVQLGAPIRLTVEGAVNTDFILQEPPKHAFYDNRPTINVNDQPVPNPNYGGIVNVSRQNGFNVSLLSKSQQSFSATAKDSSTWNIGGSVAASAGATVGAGIPDIDDASVSVDVTAKVGYDYNQNKESYNSNYSQTTLTQTDVTDTDDKVIGKLQLFDVWRYRVYGVTVTDPENSPTNAFYEVVLPGPVVTFDSGGLSKDWYQPVFENGNLLSYPTAIGQPADLGGFRVPCPADKVAQCVPCKLDQDPSCTLVGGKSLTLIVAQPLVGDKQFSFGGTSGALSYDWQNTENSGNAFSYSHKLAESLEVKVAFEATVDTIVDNDKVRASVDAEFHNSNSWGKSETSDTSNSKDTGITLNIPSGNSNQAYNVYPTFYIAQDGTVKVSHVADILGGGASEFWSAMYGRKADPALNLPKRFQPASVGGVSGWVPTLSDERKKLRGFFLRKAELNPVTNTYDLLASNPPAGQKVRVEARVYNYSTAVVANNLKVRFQVIGYDSDSDSEVALTSCPGGAAPLNGRCTVGETFVAQMTPLQMETAVITWDTTGYGPAGAGGSSEYRVYVVLDPDNAIDETYETENPDTQYPCLDFSGKACDPALPTGLDPGQNNEGWGLATIQHPSQAEQPDAAVGADVSMDNRSLGADAFFHRRGLGGADRRERMRFNRALAQLNRPIMLRATVSSDKTHTRQSHLLVYDGDPEQGGKTIAAKLIHSGDTRGAHVWFDWTPTRVGRHTLYAKVVEKSHDSKPGNNTDTLEVNVIPADIRPPRLSVTLTPDTLRPADDRMAPVTATVSVEDDYDERPEIRLESITHDEGNDAAGDVSGAEFGADDRTFSLRARHAGRRRDARVYEVVYSATDWAGNKTFTKAYVIVPQRVRR